MPNLLYDRLDVTEPNVAKENAIRLVGGRDRAEGCLEIYQFGHWGKVCGNSWDMMDAIVVCRELGYFTAVAATCANGYQCYGQTWEYSISCTGDEESVMQCSRTNVAYCSGRAVVNCTGMYTYI